MRYTVTYFILFCFMPVVFFSSCSLNNTKEDPGLEKYFKEKNVQGFFAMFDNGAGEFTLYNTPRFRDTAYLPAATFDIVSSLVGIETGRLKDSTATLPWDGIQRRIPEWNQELSMTQAFKYSAIPWFQQLNRNIGKDTLQHWIDTLGYASLNGKATIVNNLDTFWMDNSVKITGDEQLGLVKKLYFHQLPFQERSQRVVTAIMKKEDNANYILSYQQGAGVTDKNQAITWLTGWIEENRHPYFFVLQTASPDSSADMTETSLGILKKILAQYGFMEGKK